MVAKASVEKAGPEMGVVGSEYSKATVQNEGVSPTQYPSFQAPYRVRGRLRAGIQMGRERPAFKMAGIPGFRLRAGMTV